LPWPRGQAGPAPGHEHAYRAKRAQDRSAVAAAVVGLLTAGVLAASDPAIAAPPPASTQAAAAPLGKLWRVSDPAAYSRAVRSGNWIFTPEGLAYKTCVNHVPLGGKVARNGDIITRSGVVRRVVRCTTPTLTYPVSRASSGKSAGAAAASTSCSAPAAASWRAETCAFNPAGLATRPALLGACRVAAGSGAQ